MADTFKFVKISDNDKLIHDTYRLRYEVYCNELQFLNRSNYPNGLETDVYDRHSVHFAALNRENDVVGTIRLILSSRHPFPLEKYNQNLFIDIKALPRTTLSEISRFVVSKNLRGIRFGLEPDGSSGSLENDAENRTKVRQSQEWQTSMIFMGLIRLLYQESKRLGITHWYAAMEKRLWASLNSMSFHFDAIGPEFEYYGTVAPYMTSVAEFDEKLLRENPKSFKRMNHGLSHD